MHPGTPARRVPGYIGAGARPRIVQATGGAGRRARRGEASHRPGRRARRGRRGEASHRPGRRARRGRRGEASHRPGRRARRAQGAQGAGRAGARRSGRRARRGEAFRAQGAQGRCDVPGGATGRTDIGRGATGGAPDVRMRGVQGRRARRSHRSRGEASQRRCDARAQGAGAQRRCDASARLAGRRPQGAPIVQGAGAQATGGAGARRPQGAPSRGRPAQGRATGGAVHRGDVRCGHRGRRGRALERPSSSESEEKKDGAIPQKIDVVREFSVSQGRGARVRHIASSRGRPCHRPGAMRPMRHRGRHRAQGRCKKGLDGNHTIQAEPQERTIQGATGGAGAPMGRPYWPRARRTLAPKTRAPDVRILLSRASHRPCA